MPNTNTNTPEIIASKIRAELLSAVQILTKDAEAFDVSHLNQISEDSLIAEIHDSLICSLDGQLQPLLDEYYEYRLEVTKDEKDTVERAYRHATGM